MALHPFLRTGQSQGPAENRGGQEPEKKPELSGSCFAFVPTYDEELER